MGAFQVLFGIYASALPLAFAGALAAVALWDLRGRDDLAGGARVAWMAGAVVVPVVGPAVVLATSTRLPRWFAPLVLAVGLAGVLVVVVVTAAVGGAG